MGEPTQIGYLTDDPITDYNAGIDAAESPDALRAFLRGWKKLAPDAIKAARRIKPEDWPEWRRGLLAERKGKFAGEEWAKQYAVILVPERMLRTSMIADTFMVPWGTAWIRLAEEHG